MSANAPEILRGTIFHTPRNPFVELKALQIHEDGGLLIRKGRIGACDDYSAVRDANPEVRTRDLRGGFLLPGFIDTHVHYPQVRLIGGFGHTLLDWLDLLTLPEEARLADPAYARQVACEFVNALASHGTTTALVFGSHFAQATAALFETAGNAGLRIRSGLVVSDRMLRPELHSTPEVAYRESKALLQRYHGFGLLSYSVTPRFALSTTEGMLEMCRTLLTEHPGLGFQTHLNENTLEIEEVAKNFPGSENYFEVYESFGLSGRQSVFAHNVHPSATELVRMAASDSSVAHCPCSNAALGSGVFPMKRHLEAAVRFALGSDVGGGTGFGMLKEALQAYLQQRVAVESYSLTPEQMLYLTTKAGAEVMNIADETGDFETGKSADVVYLRPPERSVLAGVVAHTESPTHKLAALFSLADAESIHEVRVAGKVVFSQERPQ